LTEPPTHDALPLRRETTMPLKWFSDRLEMGTWKSVNRRLYEKRKTRC
jgi:hypothetical protein